MHSPRPECVAAGLLAALCMLLPLHLCAASVSAQVADSAGQPVEDAVVSLTPRDAALPPPTGAPPQAIMDQWGKQFIPYVLPVRVGTLVEFPNRDNIKHHVYSFSPAKRFELKLYSFGSAKPVLFDQPGVVVLGCNIHDWMQAYIDVLETPFFARTDAHGHAAIDRLPAGAYRVDVWHPRLRGDAAAFSQQVTLQAQPAAIHFELPLKRDLRRTPPRYYEGGEY